MIRRPSNEIHIKTKTSRPLRLALAAGVLMLLAIAGYTIYVLGMKTGHQQLNQDRAMIEQLNTLITELRRELAASEENLAVAQRHQQIQQEAYKQISTAYAGSEQKNRYLGSRLDFYRSIISPEDGQQGPVIQSLAARNLDGDVSFDVTLVQAIRHKHQVRGSLYAKLYDSDQLIAQWPENNPRSINFQYFQQISGVMEGVQLTENAKMKLELTLQDGTVIERWFDVPSNPVETN